MICHPKKVLIGFQLENKDLASVDIPIEITSLT